MIRRGQEYRKHRPGDAGQLPEMAIRLLYPCHCHRRH